MEFAILDKIEERAQRATAGPWYAWQSSAGGYEVDTGSPAPREICHGAQLSQEDAEFIAAARVDIPRLLDALRDRDRRLAELMVAEPA